MRHPSRIVLFAGLAAAAAVIGAGALGLLDAAEWWTQDIRFRHARQDPEPLDDRIRLVAIDDAALDTIGRWPWSREILASALDEIARAGAKAVAMDLLLGDRQSPGADEALAAAVARGHTVVAVNMDEGRMDARTWGTPEGAAALDAIVRAAATDITQAGPAIADRAGLEGERRARFLERPSAFKRIVAWRRLLELRAAGDPPADAPAFVRLMTGGDATLDRFAERALLEEAFSRDRSFRLLSRFLAPGTGEGDPMDVPPLPEIAERAVGAGFVNSRADADGQYRRVRPLWPTPYGSLPQLGIAAALAYLGEPSRELRVEGDRFVLPGGRRMPLSGGELRVDWPTDMFERSSRAGGAPVADGGMMAIGALVQLARQREVLAGQEARYRALGADFAAAQRELSPEDMAMVPVPEAARALVLDQASLLTDDLDVRGTDDVADLPEEQRRQIGAYREWRRLDREIPAARALVEGSSAEVRHALGGRLVFVGWVATGVVADMINTVFGTRTPGVFFHAAVADMVISGEEVTLWPGWTGPALAAAFGFAAAFAAWRTGAGTSTAITVAITAGWALGGGAWGYAAHDVLVPVAVPVLAALASQAASVSAAAVVHQREKARITRQFRARVSPQLVDRLAADPDALSMRGETRTATILFGDLAGFTGISEKLGSEAVVATLNLYMGAMARELTERRAYVNKFLGDGLLAFWSAFGDEPEQGQLAAEACGACQRAVREIGRRPERAGLPAVSLRLGVATGKVTIGDCGAPPDLNDYTVIGDSANLAARLESANKQFGTSILMDGATRALVRDASGMPMVALGRVVVVGQSHPVELHCMLLEEAPAGWAEGVAEAVGAFGHGDFPACEAAWAALEARFGPARVAVPFREAMSDPAVRRDGVLRLRAK